MIKKQLEIIHLLLLVWERCKFNRNNYLFSTTTKFKMIACIRIILSKNITIAIAFNNKFLLQIGICWIAKVNSRISYSIQSDSTK